MAATARQRISEGVVNVRMPFELIEYLRKAAEREQRTVGGQIRKLVADARSAELDEAAA